MSFARQLIAALVVTGSVVFGLVYVGRNSDSSTSEEGVELAESPSPVGSTESSSTSRGEADGAAQPEPPVIPIMHSSRQLVPPEAWLVVDVEGKVFGPAPFADQPGLCAKVPAPERVVVALLPPQKGARSGPEVLLAAPEVEDVFWGCTRDRIITAGGNALAQNDRFEVLQSPNGTVARGPENALLFLSGQAHLERALSVLSQVGPSAANEGPHVRLFRRMHPEGKAEGSAFDLTLALPEGWLDEIGDEADVTPLRHVTAAYVSGSLDGSASGGIDCREPGCAEVHAFIGRARSDLLERLTPVQRAAIDSGLKVEHLAGAGRISVTWTSTRLGILDLLGQALGFNPFSLSGSRPPGSPAPVPSAR